MPSFHLIIRPPSDKIHRFPSESLNEYEQYKSPSSFNFSNLLFFSDKVNMPVWVEMKSWSLKYCRQITLIASGPGGINFQITFPFLIRMIVPPNSEKKRSPLTGSVHATNGSFISVLLTKEGLNSSYPSQLMMPWLLVPIHIFPSEPSTIVVAANSLISGPDVKWSIPLLSKITIPPPIKPTQILPLLSFTRDLVSFI